MLCLMGRLRIAPRWVLPVYSVCNYYCVMSIVVVLSICGRSIVTRHLRTYGSRFGTTIGMIVSSCGQHIWADFARNVWNVFVLRYFRLQFDFS
jgi:hypothetical protein